LKSCHQLNLAVRPMPIASRLGGGKRLCLSCIVPQEGTVSGQTGKLTPASSTEV